MDFKIPTAKDCVEIVKASRNAECVVLKGDIQCIKEECDFGDQVKYKTKNLCFGVPTKKDQKKADQATYNKCMKNHQVAIDHIVKGITNCPLKDSLEEIDVCGVCNFYAKEELKKNGLDHIKIPNE